MDGAYMQRSRQAGIRWRTAMECEEGLACMGCGGEGQHGSSRAGLRSHHKLGTKDTWERTHFDVTLLTVKNSRGFICFSTKDRPPLFH